MYEYRQVIHRMRMGESDRAIAQTKLIGCVKCGQVRAIAAQSGWLGKGPLPDDEVLAAVFEKKAHDNNPTHQSLSRLYEEQIRQWTHANVCMTTIHQTLVDQFGFTGSYSSVRRLVQSEAAWQLPCPVREGVLLCAIPADPPGAVAQGHGQHR